MPSLRNLDEQCLKPYVTDEYNILPSFVIQVTTGTHEIIGSLHEQLLQALMTG